MYNVTDEYKELIQAPVRYTGISGAVRLKSGTIIPLDDGNVDSGSLSIVRKLNGKGDFRPGGVYSSYLSARLRGFAEKTSDLDGAVIRLNYLLYHDSGMDRATAEVIPLGRFYVDGSQIKRRNDVVTIKAADGLMLFDVPATERSGTLYELVCGACQAAKVDFGMSQAEFEALPNATMTATVNTSRIQTEHDLLMYVALATCSFARMTRQYSRLEFVPLTCQKNSVGVIIPVREIDGNIRFSTDFSDDVTRILKLVMRRGGKALTTTYSALPGTSDKMALLELTENPLFSELSDSEAIHALNAELPGLFECRNRPFSAAFTGDPALDVGDYVRLTGGAIDTARGYVTGMITSQTWKYHGQHTIKCEMPSSLSAVDIAETSENGIATYSESTDPPTRIQPKSQLEKRVDWLDSQLTIMPAGAVLTSYKYLTDLSAQCNGITYTAEKDAVTGLISKISDSAGHVLTPEIPEEITDIAMHNAAVFALAMARGLGAPDPAEEIIKSAIYRLYEPDGTVYTPDITGSEPNDIRYTDKFVDTGIPQSKLTGSTSGVALAFVLKPTAWAEYYGLLGQHKGANGINVQSYGTTTGGAWLYRHVFEYPIIAGEKHVLIVSDSESEWYVMHNTAVKAAGDDTPTGQATPMGNITLYNSHEKMGTRNYHGIAYDALIWDRALTRDEALAVAKRLMAQHNIGGNT